MKNIRMNTEMQCAIFASCIFVIFFSSSVVSVLKAAPFNNYSASPQGYTCDADVFGSPTVAGEPERMNEPRVGGPKVNPSYAAPCFRMPNEALFGMWPYANGIQAAP